MPRGFLGGNMGRTVMPFSYILDEERERWKEFRRALNKEDQEVFDRLFDRAKFHTHASVYMAHAWPLETILLSICLEHEKMLGDILNRLKERNS
jgi:aryl-alcohol dehydrogenase-like predicted oxidoreductase